MATSSTPPPTPRRVLIVDDNHELRSTVARYLGLMKFATVEAKDGRTALAKVASEAPFDAILIDLSLPDINGREVAREIRGRSDTVWIALVTGWDVDVDEVRVDGIDQVFGKPLNLGELSSILAGDLSR